MDRMWRCLVCRERGRKDSRTFVMNAKIILRKPYVTVFILWTPRSWQWGFLFVNHWIQHFQTIHCLILVQICPRRLHNTPFVAGGSHHCHPTSPTLTNSNWNCIAHLWRAPRFQSMIYVVCRRVLLSPSFHSRSKTTYLLSLARLYAGVSAMIKIRELWKFFLLLEFVFYITYWMCGNKFIYFFFDDNL